MTIGESELNGEIPSLVIAKLAHSFPEFVNVMATASARLDESDSPDLGSLLRKRRL